MNATLHFTDKAGRRAFTCENVLVDRLAEARLDMGLPKDSLIILGIVDIEPIPWPGGEVELEFVEAVFSDGSTAWFSDSADWLSTYEADLDSGSPELIGGGTVVSPSEGPGEDADADLATFYRDAWLTERALSQHREAWLMHVQDMGCDHEVIEGGPHHTDSCPTCAARHALNSEPKEADRWLSGS